MAEALRELSLSSYPEIAAEIERLERAGYRPLGKWNLGQICKHLNYYFRGSLDGFGFMMPWLARKFWGRPLVMKFLVEGSMRRGQMTAPQSVPKGEVDDAAEIAAAKELLSRLETADSVHPSPLAGELSVEEWKRLHCIHAAHHLSFLVPEEQE
ncbi:DUF1569 domain-containing protein [Stratiformator vulcanicus]|uniref:DinB superfamily protein n=1 Tax=Stratiformator vulcanicus TaxID=2527980 RepID=A0A517R7R7_9PLAN|nr:DUF1569 domain-containing protein [Stratiformator vulcanicus]QDT39902.1 hypothetical protein Pan189_43140 [Stratiformator vulcanicus]